jgi:endonuclease/exonuclease/phosphatase (EEP) superfamily protein YafD
VLVVSLIGRLGWTAWPFELLSNFPVQLLLLSLLAALVTGLVRTWNGLALALVAVLTNLVVVAPTFTSDPRSARRLAPPLILGHLNAQTRAIDTAALGRYLATTRPDVFVVLDPLQRDVPLIAQGAVGYEVTRTGSRPGGSVDFVRTVVLSRLPLTGVGHPEDDALGPSAVEFSVGAVDGPVSVLVFGTSSPTTPPRAHARDVVLAAAARWSHAHGPRRVVEGDFNATPWSPEFHGLVRAGGLYDSLEGYGLQPTWPAATILLRIPIDHALLGPALAATDRGTGPTFGSQHRALQVTVAARG